MSVTGATPEWTYSEYARLPDDGNRYEVIDGEVCVTPAPGPPHQRVAAELFTILQEYVRRHSLGEMLWDVDLLFVSGQFLRPDMLFVPRVVTVQEGRKVRFENSDLYNHAVNATSVLMENVFNVTTPAGQPYEHAFKHQKSPIPIGCVLHSWMRAYVITAQHPYHAVTDKHGKFRIDNVPARVSYIDRDYRYRFLNRHNEEWLAESRRDLAGKRVVDVVGEERYAQIKPLFDRVLKRLFDRDAVEVVEVGAILGRADRAAEVVRRDLFRRAGVVKQRVFFG